MATRLVATIAFVLLCTAPAAAATAEEERIEAVTEFLIERAKANYMYIFEVRIARNDHVRCYFPTVYKFAKEGDLPLLLKGRRLWEESIDADLERLLGAAGLRVIGKLDLRGSAMKATDAYVQMTRYLAVRGQGKALPLSEMALDASPQEKELINGFWKVNTLRDFLLKIDRKAHEDVDECRIPKVTVDEVKSFVAEAKTGVADLQAWRTHVRTHAGSLTLRSELVESDCKRNPALDVCKLRGNPAALVAALTDQAIIAAGAMHRVVTDEANVKLVDKLLKFQQDVQKAKAAKTHAEQVLLAIQLLRDVAPAENDELIQSLRRHVLFFAEVADAKKKEQVKAVLEEYTLPPVSFGTKRDKYKNHVMLSSYFAYGAGKVIQSDDIERKNNKGLYVPVGLEWSHGFGNRSSVSVMVAPFDFGYPVSLRLNGVSEGVKLSDIVAPSAALSFGWPDYPVALGIAYQRGRKDPTTGTVEKRVMLFIGFDMPLYSLF